DPTIFNECASRLQTALERFPLEWHTAGKASGHDHTFSPWEKGIVGPKLRGTKPRAIFRAPLEMRHGLA
ncbi:MAG: hypothetical protein ACP5XB_07570, partial [Isosphaeraceae bacterium]